MTAPLAPLAPRIDRVDCAFLREHDVLLNVLRLDRLHADLQGNKWFKLKYNVEHVLAHKHTTVLSFGGAWSNHLRALAAAGKHYGFRTIGVVRGELVEPLNPVLRFAREQGMELVPVSRAAYKDKSNPAFLAELRQRYGEFYLLPEGGSNSLAVAGCMEIAQLLRWQTDTRPRLVGLACGTGATLAGLLLGLAEQHASRANADPEPGLLPAVLGIAVVKAPGYLDAAIRQWLPHGATAPHVPWAVADDYHHGGYARSSAALQAFLAEFATWSDVPLEPVYTGKLLYGLWDRIRQGSIAAGSEILALHTGGIHQ